MKNKYLFSIACALFFGANTQAQILNSGFESWTNQTPNDPTDWLTTNFAAGGISLTPVTETTDKHSGTKAVKGEVLNFGSAVAPLIQTGNGGEGFPISQRYGSCNLFYKFTPVSGDRFAVNVVLKKDGDPIGSGAVALPATVNSYTALSVPLTYSGPETPDSVIIQITIIGPNTGSDYHVGSVMFVDDVTMNGTASLTDLTNFRQRAYPNPAETALNIPLEDKSFSELIVYDVNGEVVEQIQVSESTSTLVLDVSKYHSGLYTYTLIGKLGVHREKFLVK